MFGYIKVCASQLKVWEYELYKSTYCGLCRYGGKHTTRTTRFFLSYDFVALALMRMSLMEIDAGVEKYFCPYFPKRKIMLKPNSALEYTADAFVILSYYKILDDKNDSKGLKRICGSIPIMLLEKEAKRSEQSNPFLKEAIKSELERLSEKEKNKCSALDSVADCFASLLGKILSFGLENEKKRIAYEIGYHTGRYIYIIDALDDFKEDIKSGNYNPLVEMFGNTVRLKENINLLVDTLRGSMNTALAAYDLLDNNVYRGIIENIFTQGSEETIEKVLARL